MEDCDENRQTGCFVSLGRTSVRLPCRERDGGVRRHTSGAQDRRGLHPGELPEGGRIDIDGPPERTARLQVAGYQVPVGP